MKKLFLFAAVLLGSTGMFAQFTNIGFLGFGTPGAWDSDTDMVTTDGVTYTLENFTITPVGGSGVKFREGNDWNGEDWGGTGWPSGTGLPSSSSNIPALPGVYNITFNLSTKEYNFEALAGFDTITINGGTPNTTYTTDGIMYYSDNVDFASNTAVTFVNGSENWGGTAFPSGTATVGGAAINVPANNYNISFNNETGAYNFDYVRISIIGGAVGGWDNANDVNMTTTNGIDYTVNDVTFTAGEWKFRINNGWSVTWGNGTFPAGTAVVVADGGNMMATAGTYDGTFNRETGVFSFTESTAGTQDFNSKSITVYPNPSNSVWNFNAANNTISSMQIVDVTGKVVYTAAVNANQATVNVSGFASGMYFARLTSGNATETVRVVKN